MEINAGTCYNECVVDYRKKIVEMVEQIENPLILKLIYGFTKSGYKEEKAGRK